MKNVKFMLIMSSILFMSLNSLKAQEDKFFVFGLKAGIDVASMSGFKGYNNISGSSAHLSFIGGITLDFNIATKWAILSGLEYTTKGVDLTHSSTESKQIVPDYRANYLQLPIHAGYKLKTSDDSNVIFHGGPYLAYGVGGHVEWRSEISTSNHVDIFRNDLMQRFDYGLGIGITIDTKNFAFNLGYDHGLKNIIRSDFKFPDRPTANSDGLSIKNRAIHLTFGWKYRLGF